MTETVKLPIDLGDLDDPPRLNKRLKTEAAELDWSRVRDAPAAILIPLLGGLDLSRDADVLGLETIPEELEDAVVAALEASAPQRSVTMAQAPPAGGSPEEYEADREPVESAARETEPTVKAATEEASNGRDSDE